ncbi:MFS transporter [Nocardia sp. FBN12]|uniref:MFS transporter n=1 Tax=Nocardia sp. FBN12 TaxID=3419766 RepID=UPI003D0064C7
MLEPKRSTTDIVTISPAPSPSLIAARIDRIPFGRFHTRLMSQLGAGTFFDGFDAMTIAVVLPLIVKSFGISLAEAGLIISAGYVGQWIGMLLAGALADRVGRRRPFIISLVLFGGMSLACAFAWNETSLLVFRLVQGLGLGAEIPIAAILLSEYLGRHGRGRSFGIYQSLFAWGIFFAPLTALAATSAFGPETGWRVLLAIGALPLVIAAWAYFALPESARWLAVTGRGAEADSHVRVMEDDAARHGIELMKPEETSTQTGETFRFSELLSPAYRARTLMLAVVWFATFFVNYGCLSWLPTMYVQVGRLPQSQSLLLAIVTSGLQLVVIYIVVFLIDRVGRRPLLIAGLAVAAIGALYGFIAIGLLGHTTWPVMFVSGCTMVVGTTVPAVFLYLYTSELYPTRMRGWATSATASLNKLASIIAPTIFGFMLSGHGGTPAVFTALGVAAVIALAAVAFGAIETRNRSLEETSA